MIYEDTFPWLDLSYGAPAQPLTATGEALDALDRDLSVDDLDHDLDMPEL